MLEVTPGLTAIFITVLIALLGLAAAWGKLNEKVHNDKCKIDENQKNYEKEMSTFQKQNREDHQLIFRKLDEITARIINGQGKRS